MEFREAIKMRPGDIVYIVPERKEAEIKKVSLTKDGKGIEFAFQFWDVENNGYRVERYGNRDVFSISDEEKAQKA